MAVNTAEKPAEKTAVPVKSSESWLRRWEPIDMFESLRDEMERMLAGAWPRQTSRQIPRVSSPTIAAWAPRVDVFEKDGSLVVKAELPGAKKEDLEVTLDRGDLEIKGERKSESEVKEEDYYRCERSFGSFYRRLPLPAEVKSEEITAEFKDGVLEVRIPKPAEEKPKAVKIDVA